VHGKGAVKYIRRRKRKGAPLFGLGLFLLCCFLLSMYFFMNSALFALKKIEITGCQIVPKDKVVQLSGLALGTNLFKIDSPGIVTKLTMYPVIKAAKVSRKLPSTLVITITERTPVVVVVGNDGYLAVDVDGIYVKKINDLQHINLPIISGIVTDGSKQTLGTNINTPGLTAALKLIKLMGKTFLDNVSEINAASPYNLTLKTMQGVEIRFGQPEKIEQKLKVIEELLSDNGQVINDQTVEYIDLRYDSLPVIKRKK
jgi:cell division protein FtsQ